MSCFNICCHVIRLREDINLSETLYTSKMILTSFKHLVLKKNRTKLICSWEKKKKTFLSFILLTTAVCV